MAFMIRSVGLNPSDVMSKPANSTVSNGNLNLSGLNTIPFRAQSSM